MKDVFVYYDKKYIINPNSLRAFFPRLSIKVNQAIVNKCFKMSLVRSVLIS